MADVIVGARGRSVSTTSQQGVRVRERTRQGPMSGPSMALISRSPRGRDGRYGRRVGVWQVDARADDLRPGDAVERSRPLVGARLSGDRMPASARRSIGEVQMVFQNPHASLNPRRTVGQSVAEGIRTHRLVDADRVDRRCRNCSRRSDSTRAIRSATRTSSRAVSCSAWGSRGRWPSSPACWFAMSRSPPSTSRYRAQVLNLLNRLKDAAGAVHRLHRARSGCRAAHVRPDRDDVPRRRSSKTVMATTCTARQRIHTPGLCSRPFRRS